MFNFKKIDFSYQSLTRYIIDLNVFIGLAVVVTYQLESITEYQDTKAVINMWMFAIGIILLLRAVEFSIESSFKRIKEDKETDKKI